MDRVLIYEDETGRCRIVCPSSHFQREWENEEVTICRLAESAIPDVTDFICCRRSHLPEDRTFRSAWRKGTTNEPIKIDLEACKDIHREHLRQAAERKIGDLDTELEQALKASNLPQAVATRRTMTALNSIHGMNLTHCKTPEDVKYSIPKELHDVWSLYPPVRPSP